jgi:hypothetical protein
MSYGLGFGVTVLSVKVCAPAMPAKADKANVANSNGDPNH